jgi:hypothetical protein
MQFVIPLLCNANKEPIGVFSAKTAADGDLVVVFSNKAKWDRFARAAGRMIRNSDQYLASVELEGENLDAVVRQLMAMDPNISNQATFLPDSAPVVEQLIAGFEKLSR